MMQRINAIRDPLKYTRFVIRQLQVNRRVQVTPASCYSTKNDPDFIHVSILPSGVYQDSLPRLPIPNLENTCDRYLRSQSVLLTEQELAETTKITKHFQENEGKVLDQELRARDKKNKHTSYISEPWFDMYLRDRQAVVLNHNPFMAFADDPRPEYMNQLLRSTNMVVSSMRFMKALRANVIEPDIFHLNPKRSDNDRFRRIISWLPRKLTFYGAFLHNAFPLDMSQYKNLFNSTRIPRFEKDELFCDPSAKHIMVMRKGHIYLFDVIDRDGNIVKPEDIMANLKYILDNPSPPAENPLGVLTTLNRDKWATVRAQMPAAGPQNEGYLHLIDSALFTLCLDDVAPTDPNLITRNFLHADGTNRWYDKSFSLIITKEGGAAVNFEHSWGDGVAMLRYFEEIYKDTTQKANVHPDTQPSTIDSPNIVQRLDFHLDKPLQNYINEARTNFSKLCSTLDLDFIQYHEFGKQFLKTKSVSPDSVMQFVIQLAYYKQFGKTAATYESCSTAAFKHGRTETIRSATPATKKAVEMISRPSNLPTPQELQQALRDCSDAHGDLTKAAAMGRGWDRHLFAMRYYAQKEGRVPAFYEDPAYSNINKVILSTSTLSSSAIVIGGFGAVQKNGYGIGYSVLDDSVGFNVTNYLNHGTDVHEFIECLKQSLDDVQLVFQEKTPRFHRK